jgi:hypothetical protein
MLRIFETMKYETDVQLKIHETLLKAYSSDNHVSKNFIHLFNKGIDTSIRPHGCPLAIFEA